MTKQPRETSGATTSLLLRYVRAQGGDAAVTTVLERTGLTDEGYALENYTSAWTSYDVRIRLFEAATEVLDDPRTMFHVGAQATVHGADHPLILVLRSLSNPRQVYRHLPRAAAKFTSTSTMEVLDTTATSASLRFRLHDGYPHSRLDCEYVQGLLSEVPRLFGLPRATVEHEACQSDGHPACLYEVRWAARRRRWLRPDPTALEVEVRALRGQVQELQTAASDLVSSDDAATVLERLVDRAAGALLAPAYLLVAGGHDGTPPVVHAKGLSDATAHELAEVLRNGGDLGPDTLVVDVASQRRAHGKLAVLYSSSDRAMEQDVVLAKAYATYAAAALDLLTALDDSRREESRASALLSLAHALSTADGPDSVAQMVVGAVPEIVGCDGSAVMEWDAATGTLSTVASREQGTARAELIRSLRLESTAMPEMARLLTDQGPLLLDVDHVSPQLAELFARIDVHSMVVVPLQARGVLMGVVTASWPDPIAEAVRREALVRISGVADQAATALHNARLLETVRHQALHDALTGLPNRVLFTRGLDEALRDAAPGSGTAVLFCDLDQFKTVNDRRGHAAGDELLRQAAARLRGVLRPGDGVGRLSGDEFAVRLDHVDEQSAVAVAERIVESLDQPFRIDGQDVRVTVTVGVAVHQGTDGRGERLLAAADTAMYEAKERGRNQVGVAGALAERLVVPSLEAELGRAVEAGQMRLFFQPVVDVTSPDADVVGAEALLRWAHPRLGLLAPAAFLPLAEESGLVTDLDLWAVRAACEALAGWDAGDRPPLRIAVNLASPSLLDPRLVPTVRAALADHGLTSDRLHLELVESRSLKDLPGVIDRLVELRRLGVRISLDDFGTGYSTLTWLQALPVDQIKIDRSFIMRLPADLASVAVVRGVMALARELELEVIAEGVEDAEQLAMLRDMGCVMVQGYLLGRPGPALALGPETVTAGAGT